MAYPPIQSVPQPPLLSDSEDDFDTKAVRFNLALPPLAEQINAMGAWMDSIAQEVSGDADNAAQSAQSASDDATQTAADRVRTGQDRTAAAQSAQSASDDASQTAADRVQTGEDRTATAQDRQLAEAARDEAQAISETGLPAQDGNAGRVLGTDGASTSWVDNGLGESDVNALIAAAKVIRVDVITESQDWTKETRARLIIFQGVAPGGAGARSNVLSYNVAGGSGGQGFRHIYLAEEIPDNLPVLMGAPGVGSTDSAASSAVGSSAGNIEIVGLFRALGGLPGAVYNDSAGLSRFSPPAGAAYDTVTIGPSLTNFGMQHLSFYDSGYGGCGHKTTFLSTGGNSSIGGAGGAGINPTATSGSPGGRSQFGGDGGDSSQPGSPGGDGGFPGGGGAGAINAKPGDGGAGQLTIIQMG